MDPSREDMRKGAYFFTGRAAATYLYPPPDRIGWHASGGTAELLLNGTPGPCYHLLMKRHAAGRTEAAVVIIRLMLRAYWGRRVWQQDMHRYAW